MAALTNKVLVIIACVLALIGWIVALAGVAKWNDACNKASDDAQDWYDNYYNNNNNNGRGNGRYHGITHEDCSEGLSYHWWGVWFGFFLVIIVLIMSIMGKADNWVSTLQAFCATCLSVSMIDANAAYHSRWYFGADTRSAGDAVLAGFILVSIALMLLIIFLGMGGAGITVNVRIAASRKTAPEKPSSKPATVKETTTVTTTTTVTEV